MQDKRRTSLVTAVVAVIGAVALTGCSATTTVDAEQVADAVVIDVRTAAEYDAGHLDTAVNHDVQSPDFASQVATLDPDGSYLVYCRSGSRAGVAVDHLVELGFEDVRNIGGLDEAAEVTGLPVVR